MLKIYLEALAGVAVFALRGACDAFIRGDVGDGWLPPPGPIRTEANKRAEPIRAERVQIDRVLKAEVVLDRAPASKEAVRALADAVIKSTSVARPKNEIARGFADQVDPNVGLSPMEVLHRNAKRYRENPVTLSPSILLACRDRGGDVRAAGSKVKIGRMEDYPSWRAAA